MKNKIIPILLIFCLVSSQCFACTRWWVGGGSATTWAAITPTNWGDASNTQDNVSVPGATDDVCFNGVGTGASNSTLSAGITVQSLDFTGYSNTFTHNTATTLQINGSLKFSSGMTYTSSSSTSLITMEGTTGGNVTTAGKLIRSLTIGGVAGTTGTWTLQDALTVNNNLTLTRGGFNTNAKTVSTNNFASSNSNNRTLTACGSSLTTSGTGTPWNFATGTNLTLTDCTSNPWTVNFTDTTASSKTFAGGGKNYKGLTVNFSGGASTTDIISGANTFNSLSLPVPGTMTFPSSAITLFNSISCTGSSGNVITINSSSGGTQGTLQQQKGRVSCDWLNLTDSASSWVAFYAGANSTNTSNNSGWIFSAAPGNIAKITKLRGYASN